MVSVTDTVGKRVARRSPRPLAAPARHRPGADVTRIAPRVLNARAGPASPLPRALHPHRVVLDEPGPRWFGLLTDKLIRRGAHTSVPALENDIKAWIATWNDNPRPFTWTKTADEILNSLASYLAKLGTRQSTNRQE
jgi:hypothetical protein